MLKGKRKKIFLSLIILFIVIGSFGGIVNAKNKEDGTKSDEFSINIETVSQDNDLYYEIDVEVYNGGKDFNGMLRVSLDDGYEATAAYDISISQAEKTTKTYRVKILKDVQGSYFDKASVSIFSESGKLIKNQKYNKIFSGNQDVMEVGILSDSYDCLSYFDMYGNSIFLIASDYYIGLNQITSDNLLSDLDKMRFLIIDDYDISTLDQEKIHKIQEWVSNGGMLIIGTGECKDKTFSAFDPDFIEAELRKERGDASDNALDNISDNASATDALDNSSDASSDTSTGTYLDNNYYSDSKVPMADIDMYGYAELYDLAGGGKSYKDGSIIMLKYSLSNPKVTDTDRLTEMAENIFIDAVDNSNYIMSSNGVYTSYYGINEAMNILKGYETININGLKWIIIIYVILIGPVLYLVLKACKKREMYWILIPVVSFLCVGLVYVVGRGISVDECAANSVTIVDVSGEQMTNSYISCYNADPKPWKIKLADGTISGGIGNSAMSYQNSNGLTESDYGFRFISDSNGYSLGYKPDTSFDDAMFRVVAENKENSSIDYKIEITDAYAKGTVTNNTPYDFSYMMVLDGDYYVLVKDVKAGETIYLEQVDYERGPLELVEPDTYMYDVMEYYYDKEDYETATAVTPIYFGLYSVYGYNQTAVIGSVKNYKNVTDDEKCTEASWGCLYETNVK